MMQLFPVQRCRDCGRVREGLYHDWTDHPPPYEHSILVICRTCMDLRRQERERQWLRDSREWQQRARRGLAKQSDDPFKNFREGER